MSEQRQDAQNAFSRRTFVRLSLMTAALATGRAPLFGEEASAAHGVPYFGALRALAPGAVTPQGWLEGWLQKQAAELGSHLPEVSWPFTQDYWGEEREGAYFTPEQEYEVWWPWEQKGYWIDGATRLGILLRKDALLEKSTAPIAYTMTHPDAEGYLGPEAFEDPLADYHRWPHTVFFRSVAAAYDSNIPVAGLTHDQITTAMQRHYLSDPASYGKPKRNVNNIEDMLWLYAITGDKRLLALAENAWQEYQKYADDPENADLGVMRVEGDTPINAHGETYAETSKQPAILYLYTGKQEYLRFAEADQRRIFDFHMLIDGIPSTSEWFGTRTALDSHETCDIADHTWSWGYMLQATGDGIWGDRIERACFNAGMGAVKKDWKALQYFSCPNQVLATLTSDHNWPKFKEHGMGMMAFQPNPGLRTACCGGNVHRIFPNYVIRMWMTTPDNGVAAVLYGPSKVKLPLGEHNTPVEITQETNYPFEDQIRFKVNCAEPVNFPLSLRIPRWCNAPKLSVNGKSVAVSQTAKGFAVLHRTFHPGDEITLTLPMHVSVSHWPENGIGVERGPLVYSLNIEPHWTTTIEPRYSTAEFPAWEATPQSEWNYGLAVDRERLDAEVSIDSTTPGAEASRDPWLHPPITLKVPAKKIADWTMQVNPDNPNQRFTPPLPDASESKVSETVEHLTLVPYGSTHLRLTIFPDVSSLSKDERT
jgi:hypothetical protein